MGVAGTKKLVNGSCNSRCQNILVEDSFSITGAVAQLVLYSGLDGIVKLDRDKAAPFLKSFKVDLQPGFKDDMKTLGDAMSSCKAGNPFKMPNFDTSKLSSLMPDTPMKVMQEKKDAAYSRYLKKKGKKMSFEKWSGRYDHLQGKEMHAWKKYIKIKGGKEYTGMDYKKFCELLKKKGPGTSILDHTIRPAEQATKAMIRSNRKKKKKGKPEKGTGGEKDEKEDASDDAPEEIPDDA